eukprot:scaffold68365_cov63-Phaeocystis_antarctica.AAC.5
MHSFQRVGERQCGSIPAAIPRGAASAPPLSRRSRPSPASERCPCRWRFVAAPPPPRSAPSARVRPRPAPRRPASPPLPSPTWPPAGPRRRRWCTTAGGVRATHDAEPLW